MRSDLADPRAVHGLANSHVTWRPLARAVAGSYRVLAVDLPGHGRSPRAGRSVRVTATQDVLDRVLKRLDTPATLVGHSMGASIAVLQAAYRPDTVSGLVLLAPPVPHRRGERISPALAAWVALCTWPWLARTLLDIQLRRLGPEELVRRRLQLTCASGDPIDESTRRLLVQLVAADTQGEDHAALVEAARSVGFLVARASAYARAIEAVQAPTLVVHGAEDRILSQVGVRRLKTMQPLWRTEVLDGVGHSPHLDAPRRTAEVLAGFLGTCTTSPSSLPSSSPSSAMVRAPGTDAASPIPVAAGRG